MNDYSYLNHVDSEFLGEKEELGEEADRMLKEFFQPRKGTQYKAFIGDSLRYFIIPSGDGVEILEEEGEWEPGNVDIKQGNDYELIYEQEGKVRVEEEVSAAEAEAHLL
ncbi:MAG: hypothetical protein ABEJ03_02875 [Candidatus Nanohaloarchaea archaeon]